MAGAEKSSLRNIQNRWQGKMKEQHIFSKNSTYQLIEVLKTNRNKRYRQNCFLVEGVRSLNEAVKNGWTIRSLVYCPEQLSGWAKADSLEEDLPAAIEKTSAYIGLHAELAQELGIRENGHLGAHGCD